YLPVRLVARRHYSGPICRLQIEGSEEVVRITPEHPVYVLKPTALAREAMASAAQQAVGTLQRQMALLDPKQEREDRWLPAGQMVVGDEVILPVDDRDILPPGEGDESVYCAVVAVDREEYDGYVYNLSVEKDESYTLAAGFVVHNCDFFKNN